MTKYPLTWPTGWKRTKEGARIRARFSKQQWHSPSEPGGSGYNSKTQVTIAEGTKRLLSSLDRLGATGEAIISSNLALRLDGLPRGGQGEPDDPGVAVYWEVRGHRGHKVMAIDLYDRVADNLAAIAATLEAMRAIERHGGAQILERAFTGFDALPAPKDWRDILGAHGRTSLEEIRILYRTLANKHHPDRGGSHEKMAELNRAWESAQRELSDGA